MIISDRLSAFECLWGNGVPGKGAALNAISLHWFQEFQRLGIGDHHIISTPHPLVWVVQKAKPLKFEGIIRHYMAGSMNRLYAKGHRTFGGVKLPEWISPNQKLPEPLITPTTKGIVDILTVSTHEDAPISYSQIVTYSQDFGLLELGDLSRSYEMMQRAAQVLSDSLELAGQVFVDTKFEFGYNHKNQLIFIDEVGTPDSSRFWSLKEYEKGNIVEASKEGFRQYLLSNIDPDVLTDPQRMDQRKQVALDFEVPSSVIADISTIYSDLAFAITGQILPVMDNPREEIMQVLGDLSLLT